MTSTAFFSQNWETSSGDVTNGYINNWYTFTGSKKIRLLHVSVKHTGANHIRLYVYPRGSNQQFNLVDDNFSADQDAVWNGSMILEGLDSVGAQILYPALADRSWLRVIWEEI